MAYCSKCGEQLASDGAPCPKCSSTGKAENSSTGDKGELGIEENIAGLLCYAAGWVTGLVFFLIDKRSSVRFHAAQSMVVFGALQIAYIVLPDFFRMLGLFSLGASLVRVLQLLGVVLWILLMVKAYQGEKFKIPVAADIASSLASK